MYPSPSVNAALDRDIESLYQMYAALPEGVVPTLEDEPQPESITQPACEPQPNSESISGIYPSPSHSRSPRASDFHPASQYSTSAAPDGLAPTSTLQPPHEVQMRSPHHEGLSPNRHAPPQPFQPQGAGGASLTPWNYSAQSPAQRFAPASPGSSSANLAPSSGDRAAPCTATHRASVDQPAQASVESAVSLPTVLSDKPIRGRPRKDDSDHALQTRRSQPYRPRASKSAANDGAPPRPNGTTPALNATPLDPVPRAARSDATVPAALAVQKAIGTPDKGSLQEKIRRMEQALAAIHDTHRCSARCLGDMLLVTVLHHQWPAALSIRYCDMTESPPLVETYTKPNALAANAAQAEPATELRRSLCILIRRLQSGVYESGLVCTPRELMTFTAPSPLALFDSLLSALRMVNAGSFRVASQAILLQSGVNVDSISRQHNRSGHPSGAYGFCLEAVRNNVRHLAEMTKLKLEAEVEASLGSCQALRTLLPKPLPPQ